MCYLQSLSLDTISLCVPGYYLCAIFHITALQLLHNLANATQLRSTRLYIYCMTIAKQDKDWEDGSLDKAIAITHVKVRCGTRTCHTSAGRQRQVDP